VKIPLRDGVRLNATFYKPAGLDQRRPCLFTLTPYIGQSYHDRGMFFAAHGYPFLTVDVRGRGNSEGFFRPLIQEAKDGYDIVEWLAQQPYCNGKISMWGGSYAGYDQWATAKEFPPHLATIVPVASPAAGVDFPARNNVFAPYDMPWLTFTSGHRAGPALCRRRFLVETFAAGPSPERRTASWTVSRQSFPDLQVGQPQTSTHIGTATTRPANNMPIVAADLDVTGMYDYDQPGALAHIAAICWQLRLPRVPATSR
jgi:pimeloyl-ACP methyl ester carboxylesterase